MFKAVCFSCGKSLWFPEEHPYVLIEEGQAFKDTCPYCKQWTWMEFPKKEEEKRGKS